MKIISYAKTTNAVKARAKGVTRREWQDRYAERFHKGDICLAYDKSPRCKGQPFGLVILLETPYRERTCDIPDSDWLLEGFAYMAEHGELVGPELACADLWAQWKADPEKEAYVIRFEILWLIGEPRRNLSDATMMLGLAPSTRELRQAISWMEERL